MEDQGRIRMQGRRKRWEREGKKKKEEEGRKRKEEEKRGREGSNGEGRGVAVIAGEDK